MKKLVAFAMILSLGLFCAVGCKPAPKDTPAEPAVETEEVVEGEIEVPAPDAAKPGDEAEAPAPAE